MSELSGSTFHYKMYTPTDDAQEYTIGNNTFNFNENYKTVTI